MADRSEQLPTIRHKEPTGAGGGGVGGGGPPAQSGVHGGGYGTHDGGPRQPGRERAPELAGDDGGAAWEDANTVLPPIGAGKGKAGGAPGPPQKAPGAHHVEGPWGSSKQQQPRSFKAAGSSTLQKAAPSQAGGQARGSLGMSSYGGFGGGMGGSKGFGGGAGPHAQMSSTGYTKKFGAAVQPGGHAGHLGPGNGGNTGFGGGGASGSDGTKSLNHTWNLNTGHGGSGARGSGARNSYVTPFTNKNVASSTMGPGGFPKQGRR